MTRKQRLAVWLAISIILLSAIIYSFKHDILTPMINAIIFCIVGVVGLYCFTNLFMVKTPEDSEQIKNHDTE